MRPAFLLLVANAATTILVGCYKPDASTRTPASSIAQPHADAKLVSISTAGDPLDLLTSRIDTTVTLGAWLRSHPSDTVSAIAPVEGLDDPFCRAAVVNGQVAGRRFVRSALFYIPVPPKGEQLPADTAKVAEEVCELRTIVLASEEMDFPAGHVVRDTLALLIGRRLGPHRDGLGLGAGGIRGTTEGKTWNGPGTTVVIAAAPSEQRPSGIARREDEDGQEAPPPPVARVFAVAYAPGSGAQDFDTGESRRKHEAAQTAEDRKSLYRNVDSAIVWAALPNVATDVRTVLTYLRSRDEDNPNKLRPPQVDTALLRALKATRDAAPSLPPPRRAAALLAADVVLFATFPILAADSTTALRRALMSLGITFDDLPISQSVQNTRPWLWEAYELDPLGRAGRAAFIELLAQGWTTRGACVEGGNEYAQIIAHGERALSKGDNNPRIHFYVASAYKTIYDLANYGDNEYFDSESAKPQAESARLKGIEHYRLALESLPDRALRREAWTKAMRLILQRSGEQPEYVCFYD